MKELLVETHPFQYTSAPVKLIEGLNNISSNKNLFVEGVLATVEVKNGNGRYYSRELWERELSKFQKKIDAGTTETIGELDHPSSTIINLKNGSHAIRKIWWEGDLIKGILEIFSDPGEYGTISGRILGAYVKNKLLFGISSRGLGSLEQKGEIMEVQDDFDLLTWDAVSNPSNPGSWMKSTQINEGLDLTKINKNDRINKIITEILCSNGSCLIDI